jgi:plastocyanin
MKKANTAFLICMLVVICTTFSCKKSDENNPPETSNPGTNEVFIQNMAFNPGTITVAANTTVKWTNKDATAHTVTSNTGLFDSGSIAKDGTFSHLFASPGSYSYKCTFHPSMTATIIVN